MKNQHSTKTEGMHRRTPVVVTEAFGQSEAFLDFQERLSRVAPCNRPVLLMGERGTGKELAAFRLHFLSDRWEGPFITLNCSALSSSLIESELFGYEKGAFTGAERRKSGRFEAAAGGTLFLDEVGNIPMEVQEKILRVVEYGVFEPVGSTESIEVDVRIISATNADLPELAATGRFKQDLLDRLSFEVLLLPPLRERKGDIPLLASHFAARMSLELGRQEMPAFSKDALSALETYPWPGNVRELKNVVERAVYRSDSALVTEIDTNPFRSPYSSKATVDAERHDADPHRADRRFSDKPLDEAVRELKVVLLRKALAKSKHNQKQAALALGLTYHQFRGLYRKLRREIEEG